MLHILASTGQQTVEGQFVLVYEPQKSKARLSGTLHLDDEIVI